MSDTNDTNIPDPGRHSRALDHVVTGASPFRTDEFELSIEPHATDGFRVQAPGLARALGFGSAKDLLRSIPHNEKGWALAPTLGGEQRVGYLIEAGFYRALGQRQAARIADPGLRARVERFQSWVYGTVLPEIRRTGSFKPAPALTGSELMAAGYVEAMKQLEQRDVRIHQLETKVTADAPKVAYIDQYVTDADCLTFSTVASTNNVKESWLRDLLIEKGWIYTQTDSRWSNTEEKKVERNRYSEKADKKRYFRRIPEHKAPRFRGTEVMHTLKITPAGAEAIARLIAKEVAA